MTTSRIKEKISALVNSQLPEFIQTDFPTFVSFIEAYYRFLEQDQGALEIVQNAKSYNDVDTTVNSFVEHFLNTYAKNTPKILLLNDRFLVKKIKDLYEAKGSELSFKLLFRALFNASVEIKVPYENVLKPSSGVWEQNFSIKVETVSGDRNLLTNRFVTHTAAGVVFKTPILRTKILSPTIIELFLDSILLSSSYTVGDTVEVYDTNDLLFSGIIRPTTTSVRIDLPGQGFKIGQIFDISASGVGTLVKVTKISPTGGIERLKILSFGFGYQGDLGGGSLTVVLDKDNSLSRRDTFFNTKLGGFGSSGFILKQGPTNPERYFESDYLDNFFYSINEITATFNNDAFSAATQTTGGTVPSNLAVINFTLGALARYPGAYIKDQGFISESEVRIQDDELYQPFAYQTNTDVDISQFLDIVKKLINPAGQILYNNRVLLQELDISDQLEIKTDRKIFVNVHDFSLIKDNSEALLNTFKDNIGIIDTDDTHQIFKTLEDLVSIADLVPTVGFNRLEDELVFLSELIIVTQFVREFFDNDIDLNEITSIATNKILDNETAAVEDIEKIETFIQDYFNEIYVVEQKPLYVLTKTGEILNP